MSPVVSFFPDDMRSELFCHQRLTGDILQSDVDEDGMFQMQQPYLQGFCEVQ